MTSTKTSQLNVDRCCKDILTLDDEIVTVVIADALGQIVAMDWKKEYVPWENHGVEARKEFESIEGKLGAWMQIIIGLAAQTESLIGSFERATFIHKQFQLVLVPLSSKKNCFGLMLRRSANVDHVISKVKEIILG
jgi:hypothetical protein